MSVQPASGKAGDNLQLTGGSLCGFWSEGHNTRDPLRPGQEFDDCRLGPAEPVA